VSTTHVLSRREGAVYYWYYRNVEIFEDWAPCWGSSSIPLPVPPGWENLKTVTIPEPGLPGNKTSVPFTVMLKKGKQMAILVRGTQNPYEWLIDMDLRSAGGGNAWILGVSQWLNHYNNRVETIMMLRSSVTCSYPYTGGRNCLESGYSLTLALYLVLALAISMCILPFQAMTQGTGVCTFLHKLTVLECPSQSLSQGGRSVPQGPHAQCIHSDLHPPLEEWGPESVARPSHQRRHNQCCYRRPFLGIWCAECPLRHDSGLPLPSLSCGIPLSSDLLK